MNKTAGPAWWARLRRAAGSGLRSALALGWAVAFLQFGAHLAGENEGQLLLEAQAADEVEVAALDTEHATRDYDVRNLSVDNELELSAEMSRVRDWVASEYRVPRAGLLPALAEAEVAAREADLDPLLIVAMIAVESSFNPNAESHAGALGLMQVIPRWHWDKIGEENDKEVLFDPRFNVQVGTLVLVEGLQRYGSLEDALQYYNGARNDPQRRYTRRVLSVKEQLYSVANAGTS